LESSEDSVRKPLRESDRNKNHPSHGIYVPVKSVQYICRTCHKIMGDGEQVTYIIECIDCVFDPSIQQFFEEED